MGKICERQRRPRHSDGHAGPPPAQPLAGTALARRLYIDPRSARGRAGADLRADLAARRATSPRCPRPGSYLTASAGSAAGARRARRGRHALRAYRNVCRHRGSRLLSGSGQCKAAIRCRYHGWTYRLDGHADRRARRARVRRAPGQVGARPDSRPRRGAVRPGVRQPRSRRDAAGRARRRPPGAARALPDPLAAILRAVRRHAARQLEGGRRQLPRGLPHPDRPPGPDAAAGLQALRRRVPRALRRGSRRRCGAGRAATGSSGIYTQLVRPMPGLERRGPRTSGATCSSIPTRRSTCTPTRSTRGRCFRTASAERATCSPTTGPPAAAPRTRLVQWINQRLNTLVLDEDIDLVANVQQGLQTRGYECGPLSRREDAVAWFADRVRADLAPVLAAR